MKKKKVTPRARARVRSAGFFRLLFLIIIIVAILTYYHLDLRQLVAPIWAKFAAWVNQLLK